MAHAGARPIAPVCGPRPPHPPAAPCSLPRLSDLKPPRQQLGGAALAAADAAGGRPSASAAARRRSGCLVPRASFSSAADAGAHQLQPGSAVARFVEAFNARSVDGMAECLAPAVVFTHMAHAAPYVGKQAVRGALASLVGGAPADWRLEVDDASSGAGAVMLVFHLADGAGRPVPLSRGIALYRLDAAGLISRITEASEQAVKLPHAALPAVGASAPLLSVLAGAAAAAAAAAPSPLFAAGPSSSSAAASSSSAAVPSTTSFVQQQRGGSGGRQPSGSVAAASLPAAAAAAAAGGAGGGTGGGGRGGGPGSIAALAGVWIKDTEASDLESYSRACDLMQLSGLQKTTAMQLIEGVEVEVAGEQPGDRVAVRFLTVVPFFKVTEAYTLGGSTGMARRDLRRGEQRAAAEAGGDGALLVHIAWGEPNAGGVEEEYRLGEDARGLLLQCTSTVRVAAGAACTRTVYRRSDAWRPRFQWNPMAALGIRAQ